MDSIQSFLEIPSVAHDKPSLKAAALKALPLMQDAISSRQVNDVGIDIATAIGSKVWGEDLTLIKKVDERRLVFDIAFIVIFYATFKQDLDYLLLKDVDELLSRYPEFQDVSDPTELKYLLEIRNLMKVCMLLIPARTNKCYLLDIVVRIVEKARGKYITGTGQTAATSRRVLIYEREGDVTRMKRQSHKRSLDSDTSVNSIGSVPPSRTSSRIHSLAPTRKYRRIQSTSFNVRPLPSLSSPIISKPMPAAVEYDTASDVSEAECCKSFSDDEISMMLNIFSEESLSQYDSISRASTNTTASLDGVDSCYSFHHEVATQTADDEVGSLLSSYFSFAQSVLGTTGGSFFPNISSELVGFNTIYHTNA